MTNQNRGWNQGEGRNERAQNQDHSSSGQAWRAGGNDQRGSSGNGGMGDGQLDSRGERDYSSQGMSRDTWNDEGGADMSTVREDNSSGRGNQQGGQYGRERSGSMRSDQHEQYGQGRHYDQGQHGQGRHYGQGQHGQSSHYGQGSQYGGRDQGGQHGMGMDQPGQRGQHGTGMMGQPGQRGQYGTSMGQSGRGQYGQTGHGQYGMGMGQHGQAQGGDHQTGEQSMRQGFAGKGPKGYQRSDDRVREQLCDAFSDDDSLDASDIEIKVESGEVTLTGTVPSRHCKRTAEDIAESCSGVKEVTNQLRVKRADDTKDDSNDKPSNNGSQKAGTPRRDNGSALPVAPTGGMSRAT